MLKPLIPAFVFVLYVCVHLYVINCSCSCHWPLCPLKHIFWFRVVLYLNWLCFLKEIMMMIVMMMILDLFVLYVYIPWKLVLGEQHET